MIHANGWGTPFSGTSMDVRHVVLLQVDGADIFLLVQAEKVTWDCMAPAVLSTVLDFPGKDQYQPSTSPRLVVAGAPDDEEVGEVVARSKVVMKSYCRQSEADDRAIVNGWFHTGDRATINREGFITIVGRAEDVIISGDENISSIEVEDILCKHPSILDCAVIGVPSERWGETPTALVVPHAGMQLTEAELMAFCRGHIAHGYGKTPEICAQRSVLGGPRVARELRQWAVGRGEIYCTRTKYW